MIVAIKFIETLTHVTKEKLAVCTHNSTEMFGDESAKLSAYEDTIESQQVATCFIIQWSVMCFAAFLHSSLVTVCGGGGAI